MSHIDGLAGLRRRINETRHGLVESLEAMVDAEVRTMQATAVDLVPKHTGNLSQLLARDDAIDKTHEGNGIVTWRFGFLTEEAREKGWYWPFVEYGTKGYTAGAQRIAGTDRRGRLRYRKVKRDVPPHKATPFMRPALILFRQKMARLGVKAFLATARGDMRRWAGFGQ
jgi:HK97 gp10 family phage protein